MSAPVSRRSSLLRVALATMTMAAPPDARASPIQNLPPRPAPEEDPRADADEDRGVVPEERRRRRGRAHDGGVVEGEIEAEEHAAAERQEERARGCRRHLRRSRRVERRDDAPRHEDQRRDEDAVERRRWTGNGRPADEDCRPGDARDRDQQGAVREPRRSGRPRASTGNDVPQDERAHAVDGITASTFPTRV